MTDYDKNEESHVSDENTQGDELVEAVEEAIDHWVAAESVAVQRNGKEITADEDELVKNISIMIIMALDELAGDH